MAGFPNGAAWHPDAVEDVPSVLILAGILAAQPVGGGAAQPDQLLALWLERMALGAGPHTPVAAADGLESALLARVGARIMMLPDEPPQQFAHAFNRGVVRSVPPGMRVEQAGQSRALLAAVLELLAIGGAQARRAQALCVALDLREAESAALLREIESRAARAQAEIDRLEHVVAELRHTEKPGKEATVSLPRLCSFWVRRHRSKTP